MKDEIPFWVVEFIYERPPIAVQCDSWWEKVRGKRRQERHFRTWAKPEAALASPWVSSISLVRATDKEEALKKWQTQKQP